MIALLSSIFFTKRSYYILSIFIALFVISFFINIIFPIAKILLLAFLVLLVLDFLILYYKRDIISIEREVPKRLSNGDINKINYIISSKSKYSYDIDLFDKLPDQLELREQKIEFKLENNNTKILEYEIRPKYRGVYQFGFIYLFLTSKFKLFKRRIKYNKNYSVKCYPSFLHLKEFRMMAFNNKIQQHGNKQIRKVGHSFEFEQIRNYVQGDDYRDINWKASARKAQIMVNQYQDEKSQPVYCVVDMGRNMKMTFNEMSLLEYSINSTLSLSDVAIAKDDKVGLITYNKAIDTSLPASKKSGQMQAIMESLYKQESSFMESNYELLYAHLKQKVKQRSMILLYSNFESVRNMERYLDYLRLISKKHLLVLIFFENVEMSKLLKEQSTKKVKDIYKKTILESLVIEKEEIRKKLEQYGIHTVFTNPKHLTSETIKKYLEIKAKRLL